MPGQREVLPGRSSYVKVNGEWKYLYRAVDKAGDTVTFCCEQSGTKVSSIRQLLPTARLCRRNDGELECGYGQSSQTAALSARCDADLRALVRGLSAQPA